MDEIVAGLPGLGKQPDSSETDAHLLCLGLVQPGSKEQQKTENRGRMRYAHEDERDLSELCWAKVMRRY